MDQTREFNSHIREVRKKIAMSIFLNAIVPVALYLLLEHLGATEIIGLAVATAIPTLGTVVHWIKRHRVDWIGGVATVGFVIALASAILLGGNTLLLKTHSMLLTGPVGFVLLASALIGRPLLLPIVQILIPTKVAESGVLEKISSNPAARRKMAIASAAIGLVLIGHAGLEVSLAMTLPTEKFLIVSKIFTWTTIGVTVILLRWIRVSAIKRI